MHEIRLGPKGWGYLLAPTERAALGRVTVNVNSRGGTEVIRAFGKGHYMGWYAETARTTARSAAIWNVEVEARTPQYAWRAHLSDRGLLRIERRGTDGGAANMEFDLRSSPDYSAGTVAALEARRKEFAGRS